MALDDYAIERELGRGGMGRVYLARHRETGAVRALKVLDGVPDPETVERFKREAAAIARLEGKGVVLVHETGTFEGRLGFVMEFMSGGSLADRLAKTGRFEWREAATTVARLARTIERCAALGLVHRDVKPQNVLYDEQGEPRLADFGCVRDRRAEKLTATGTVLGTPAYMAPEQLEGRPLDERADVFSLGVMLHELVTGERPFSGNTPYALLKAVLERRRSPIPPDRAPRALEGTVAKALAPSPVARQASAGKLARDLEALVEKGTSKDAARVRPGLVIAGITLLATLVAAAVLAGARRAPPPLPVGTGPVGSAAATNPAWVARVADAKKAIDKGSFEKAASLLESVEPSSLSAEDRRTFADAFLRAADGRAKEKLWGSLPREVVKPVFDAVAKLVAAARRFDPSVGSRIPVKVAELALCVWEETSRQLERADMFEIALFMDPKDIAPGINKMFGAGPGEVDLVRAKRLTELAHDAAPDSPEVNYARGFLALTGGRAARDLVKARASFEKVLGAPPMTGNTQHWARFHLARIAEETPPEAGRHERALALLDPETMKHLLRADAVRFRFRLLVATGRFDAARAQIADARKCLKPDERELFESATGRLGPLLAELSATDSDERRAELVKEAESEIAVEIGSY